MKKVLTNMPNKLNISIRLQMLTLVVLLMGICSHFSVLYYRQYLDNIALDQDVRDCISGYNNLIFNINSLNLQGKCSERERRKKIIEFFCNECVMHEIVAGVHPYNNRQKIQLRAKALKIINNGLKLKFAGPIFEEDLFEIKDFVDVYFDKNTSARQMNSEIHQMPCRNYLESILK